MTDPERNVQNLIRQITTLIEIDSHSIVGKHIKIMNCINDLVSDMNKLNVS